METAGWKRQGGTYYIYFIYKKKPGKKKNKDGKGVSRETMKILELRKSLKLSRKEFCEMYEIPYITVTQWERGERTPPAYLIKLIEENIKLRTKGEQISIEEFQPSCKTCKNSRQISENMIECCIYGVRGINSFCQSGMYVFQQK